MIVALDAYVDRKGSLDGLTVIRFQYLDYQFLFYWRLFLGYTYDIWCFVGILWQRPFVGPVGDIDVIRQVTRAVLGGDVGIIRVVLTGVGHVHMGVILIPHPLVVQDHGCDLYIVFDNSGDIDGIHDMCGGHGLVEYYVRRCRIVLFGDLFRQNPDIYLIRIEISGGIGHI